LIENPLPAKYRPPKIQLSISIYEISAWHLFFGDLFQSLLKLGKRVKNDIFACFFERTEIEERRLAVSALAVRRISRIHKSAWLLGMLDDANS
jgi:hypothetical protein